MEHTAFIISTELLVNLSLLIAVSVLTGFVTAQATKWLDSAMDYGKVFGDIRLKNIERAAHKANLAEAWETKKGYALRAESVNERIQAFDEAYWWVALHVPGVQKWICSVCMGTRVHMLVFFAIAIGVSAFLGFVPVSILLIFLIVSGSFNYYFL